VRSVLAATIACATVLAVAPVAQAADPFAWTPAQSATLARGRESGSRFGLLALHEVTVEVDNVFAAANREALALAEQRLADLPGVAAVFGPAGLLDVSVDGAGTPRGRLVLARGGSESEGEAARQRVVRRSDALGWFLTENGQRVRFLVDSNDWARVAPGVAAALAHSGLSLAPSATIGVRPLWPDPRARWRWLPVLLSAGAVILVLGALGRIAPVLGRRGPRRRLAVALAAAAGAAAPFAFVPVAGARLLGALAAVGAAAVVLGAPPWRTRRGAPLVLRSRLAAVPVVVAVVVLAAGGFVLPRLRVATRQWSASPLFFVSVRADIDEPVVLRELHRLTDYLRAQPGVANAWSIADLFMGVTFEGGEAARIPDDSEEVRRILVQARTDPAVRLELAADHREALIGIRFDNDPAVERFTIINKLDRYLATDFRRALAHVDLGSPATPPAGRLVGRGLLAQDANLRVLRICERSGRVLSPLEIEAVERAARQAATIPGADPARLQAELADATRDFVARHPFPLVPAEAEKLVLATSRSADEPALGEVRTLLSRAYGDRMPAAILDTSTVNLTRRLRAVRWRQIARTNFKEMLYGAGLPTEGVLADEVRSATLEAMGPIVGLPTTSDNPGAFHLDAVPLGGLANDRALSLGWTRAFRAGLVAAAAMIAILLVLLGGPGGIALLPIALAPLAMAILPAAALATPVGLPSLALFAAALSAGAALAVAATPAPITTLAVMTSVITPRRRRAA
jgi:hypothetical protein